MASPDLIAARARAATARAEVQATLHELQVRLRPANLASDAIDTVKRKSEEVAEGAADVVRRRPVVVATAASGIGALIGASWFFRRRKTHEGDPS